MLRQQNVPSRARNRHQLLPHDSATEYPTLQQITEQSDSPDSGDFSASMSSGDWDTAHEKKSQHQEWSEIDAVIGCLGSVLKCCFSPRAVSASWKCKLQLSTTSVLLLVCGVLAICYLAIRPTDRAAPPGNGPWWDPRSKMPLMQWSTMNSVNFLFPPLASKPIAGVITTHHRTGTVLFQNMGERLCEEVLIDYERVDEPFKLYSPDQTVTLLHQHYWNTSERLVIGMHGFAEKCPKGHEIWSYCEALDYKCWLNACKVTDQEGEGEKIPVIHVVRNPVEVLISAYLYHQQDPPPEEWLYDPKPDALEILPRDLQRKYDKVPYYKVLQQLPTEWGILVEFTVEMENIYRMTRNYRDMAEYDYAKNFHYESFKGEFNVTAKLAFDHLKITNKYGDKRVMNIASIFDLKNMPERERQEYQVDMHITEGKHNKQELRAAIHDSDTMRPMLDHLAQIMDYPTAFPSIVNSTKNATTPIKPTKEDPKLAARSATKVKAQSTVQVRGDVKLADKSTLEVKVESTEPAKARKGVDKTPTKVKAQSTKPVKRARGSTKEDSIVQTSRKIRPVHRNGQIKGSVKLVGNGVEGMVDQTDNPFKLGQLDSRKVRIGRKPPNLSDMHSP